MPKVKITVVENGFDKEIEVEVPEGSASWTPPSESAVLGKRIVRLDAPEKVSGRAKYTYDINLPGLLHGYILQSPLAHARIKSIDISRAEKMPGVKAIIPLDKKEVFYHGDELVGIAATSMNAAEEAGRAIKIEYEPLPHVAYIDQALAKGAPQVFSDRPNANPKPETRREGDPAAAFKGAKATVTATYETPVICHVCLEPHGLVAQWNGDDELTVWASTQGVHSVRGDLATALNIPASKINVITHHMGGGFGSKFGAGVEGVMAARLAKKAGAPVKMMMTRRHEFHSSGNRPSSLQRIKAAADADGKLVAWEIDGYGSGGINGGAGYPSPYVYRVPNQSRTMRDVFTNGGGARAMRAPGHPQGSFATEVMVDELAYQLGIDPVEFRIKNDPNELRHRQYRLGAEAIGWANRNPKPGASNGAKKRGMGLGACTWGGGGGPSTPVTVNIHPDGSVEAISGTQDLGTGTRTVIAAIIAEELGLQPNQISTKIGETRYGPSGGSGGSTTCASVSPAAKMAGVFAKQQLFEKIAPKLGVKPEQLALRDGKIRVTQGGPAGKDAKWDESKTISWKQAAARLGMEEVSARGQWIPGLSSSGVAGVQFIEVEVDTETGRVQPLKVVAVHDCGLVINRMATESQINGGVIAGIGFALLEERVLDRNTARFLNDHFVDYKIPGTYEMPEIEVIFTDQPERGVIGIGEPPVIPLGGALANAVYHACGARIRSLPVTPNKVLAALKGLRQQDTGL
ncbi:MAG: xanthine dehydrogenase family protein molybdopterin-binding subunit [Armatimonadetes bacterium]|nr:xanthine dehydrogenase family protein molybdopterin-binding subunit [Armatimonadota bacterium]